MRIFTIGHSNRRLAELLDVLGKARIACPWRITSLRRKSATGTITGRARHYCYLPCQIGSRFSAKARGPSRKSPVKIAFSAVKTLAERETTSKPH